MGLCGQARGEESNQGFGIPTHRQRRQHRKAKNQGKQRIGATPHGHSAATFQRGHEAWHKRDGDDRGQQGRQQGRQTVGHPKGIQRRAGTEQSGNQHGLADGHELAQTIQQTQVNRVAMIHRCFRAVAAAIAGLLPALVACMALIAWAACQRRCM
ncbi:MAG: hypothetical protein BWZ07_02660 [Alphaproteobacteria bacterium ADurb.BinA280]|nr:MAG: hypothetical protein BWZ07_02660 [Alphaproteobacteria bacterium ADurb.BinA280]